jgi:hypothetical protein
MWNLQPSFVHNATLFHPTSCTFAHHPVTLSAAAAAAVVVISYVLLLPHYYYHCYHHHHHPRFFQYYCLVQTPAFLPLAPFPF